MMTTRTMLSTMRSLIWVLPLSLCFALGDRGAQASALKKWAHLVFVNYDNGNAAAADGFLRAIVSSPSDARVDVVLQLDSGERAGRYLVEATGLAPIEVLDHPDSGDPAAVVDFLAWGLNRYPSERVTVSVFTPSWAGELSPDGSSGSIMSHAEFTQAMVETDRLLAQIRGDSNPLLQLDLFNIAVPSYGAWTDPPIALIDSMQTAQVAQVYTTQLGSVGTMHAEMIVNAVTDSLKSASVDTGPQAAAEIVSRLSSYEDGYFGGYFLLGPDPL